MRLLSFAWGLFFTSGLAHGEVIKSCDLIRQANREGALNPQLVLAITEVESSRNSKVVSRQGRGVHYGLMQLKPATARLMGFRGKPKDLLQWQTNIKYGVRYLDEKLAKYKSKRAAAAAYNAGAVFLCKRKCPIGHFTNQSYVDKVMKHYRRLDGIKCSETDVLVSM
jgi:soluble lytic murein transglycosylase-like protein